MSAEVSVSQRPETGVPKKEDDIQQLVLDSVKLVEVVKRGRGRPKGAKTKNQQQSKNIMIPANRYYQCSTESIGKGRRVLSRIGLIDSWGIVTGFPAPEKQVLERVSANVVKCEKEATKQKIRSVGVVNEYGTVSVLHASILINLFI